MATHSSVLAWRIPGMAGPGGLPSMGSHRVGHDLATEQQQSPTAGSTQAELTLANLTASTTSDTAQKTGQLSHGNRDKEEAWGGQMKVRLWEIPR